MKCMQNLGKQVGQISKMLEIRGECRLTNLAKTVDFITQKLDEYEKYWRDKDAITATLQNELKSTSMKAEDVEKKNGKVRIVL